MALRTSAEIKAYFKGVTANLRPLAQAAMNAAMVETESILEDVAPVDTGEYKAGIHEERDLPSSENGAIGGIGFKAPHSAIVRHYNYGGGTRQALRDTSTRIRNNLIDVAAELVRTR